MGFFEKALSVGSKMIETAERRAEWDRERTQLRYNSYSYSARDKSNDELKKEYNSTDDVIKKAAIAAEVKRRKGQ